ncbi:MAG: hypothetical protein ACLRFJ_00870 [Alphaproteobacteria bacterium]
MKNKSKNNTNRRQKVLAFIASAGLFASGLMVGLAFTKTKYVEKDIAPVTEDVLAESVADKTCDMVEKVLEPRLEPTKNANTDDHEWNIRVYNKLIKYGCAENVQKYSDLLEREKTLLNALQFDIVDDNSRVCEKIESEMLIGICDRCGGTERHLDNAKVYSILAERGCPENSQKYVDLAKQEIAIARALEDDKFSEGETLEVVETYKRINMQAAAEEVFEKAKQLTNPAIDFILQVEKIINE